MIRLMPKLFVFGTDLERNGITEKATIRANRHRNGDVDSMYATVAGKDIELTRTEGLQSESMVEEKYVALMSKHEAKKEDVEESK